MFTTCQGTCNKNRFYVVSALSVLIIFSVILRICSGLPSSVSISFWNMTGWFQALGIARKAYFVTLYTYCVPLELRSIYFNRFVDLLLFAFCCCCCCWWWWWWWWWCCCCCFWLLVWWWWLYYNVMIIVSLCSYFFEQTMFCPDQNVASDEALPCLSLIQLFIDFL